MGVTSAHHIRGRGAREERLRELRDVARSATDRHQNVHLIKYKVKVISLREKCKQVNNKQEISSR